ETIVPPDVPSYLSSQGTLSDRQEAVVRVENGQQPNGHIQSNGICQTNPEKSPVADDAPPLVYRQPKLCLGYNKEAWKADDVANGILLTDRTGYSFPVVCTDCSGSTDSTNVTICPKDLTAAENMHPNPSSSKDSKHDNSMPAANCQSPPKCNGSISNSKSDVRGTTYPSNHDRMPATSPGSSQPLTKASEPPSLLSPPGGPFRFLTETSELSEPPSLLSPSGGPFRFLTGTAELSQTLPAAEAKQTLLNGHLLRSRDSLHE
ncbi:UNVERIFIED_CONTAM: hypothetical protein K2H54_057531, partial [Gekko kuhli]